MTQRKIFKSFLLFFVLAIGVGALLFLEKSKEAPSSSKMINLRSRLITVDRFQRLRHLYRELVINAPVIFSPRTVAQAFLMDHDGQVLHSWKDPKRSWWYIVDTDDDLNLYALETNKSFVKLDAESKLLWESLGNYHHDFHVLASGEIILLHRSPLSIVEQGVKFQILNDEVVKISADGKKKEILYSVYEHYKSLIGQAELTRAMQYGQNPNNPIEQDTPADVFHVNSLKIIDRKLSEFADSGDIQLCLPQHQMVIIVDVHSGKTKKEIKINNVDWLHDPTLLSENELLFFENRLMKRSSQIVKVDINTGNPIWVFPEENSNVKFFSDMRGRAQVLSSGNILITSSQEARAIEITPANQLAWEFDLTTPGIKEKKGVTMFRKVFLKSTDR